jgi:hypothetical protein
MNVLEAIRERYSCRAYHDKCVEQGKLESIFEAARLAPSAKNLQDWRFVVSLTGRCAADWPKPPITRSSWKARGRS